MTLAKFASFFNPVRNFKSLRAIEAERIMVFDAWRVFAMVWIVCQHCVVYTGLLPHFYAVDYTLESGNLRFFYHAHFGIDVFFVLSGYLIGGILIREKLRYGQINIRRFYARRALRMLPVYYACIAIIVTAITIGVLPSARLGTNFWPNVFQFNNLLPRSQQFLSYTWSLAIEEQFYILFPVLIYFMSSTLKRFGLICIALVFCMIGAHFLLAYYGEFNAYWSIFPSENIDDWRRYFDLIYDKPYFRFSSLLIGALASYAHQHKWDECLFASKMKSILSASAATFLITFVLYKINYHYNQPDKSALFEAFYRELFCVGIAYFLLLTQRRHQFNRILSANIFHSLSHLSYGVYLVHVPIILVLSHPSFLSIFFDYNNFYPSAISFIPYIAFIVAVSAIAALILYVLVEKPFMNLREHLYGK